MSKACIHSTYTGKKRGKKEKREIKLSTSFNECQRRASTPNGQGKKKREIKLSTSCNECRRRTSTHLSLSLSLSLSLYMHSPGTTPTQPRLQQKKGVGAMGCNKCHSVYIEKKTKHKKKKPKHSENGLRYTSLHLDTKRKKNKKINGLPEKKKFTGATSSRQDTKGGKRKTKTGTLGLGPCGL